MSPRISRRLFILQVFLFTACRGSLKSIQTDKLTIGVVSYDAGEQTIEQYTGFNNYLSEKTGALVELQPTFNEAKALERINNQAWSLVFAPPGLAAIAIFEQQYIPLFPLSGVDNLRSILVVRKDSSVRDLKELNGQTVALGQLGSATGYYFPIFNLYGLTLAELLFAPTPKTALEWVAQGKVTAGALSREEFIAYSPQLSETEFHVLYTDPHKVPPGAVLIGPAVEGNFQEKIRDIMSETPSVLSQEVGYVPNGPVPDYKYMSTVVKRVRSIAAQVQQKPARLF